MIPIPRVVERLRAGGDTEAADLMERMAKALEPFAACADHYVREGYNMAERVIHIRSYDGHRETEARLTRGNFRAARTALNPTDQHG